MAEVMEYYGLVIYWARKAHQRLRTAGVEVELDTLIQEGAIGLLEAGHRYNPLAGTQFSTFASPRIRGAIEDYLRQLDPLPQRTRQRVKEMHRVSALLAQRLGREPRSEEVGAELGLSAADVEELELLGRRGEEALSAAGWDQLAAPPHQGARSEDLAADVDHCLEQALEANERQVLVLRFWEGLSLQKVGQLVGRPVQTLHNIEMRSRGKMKRCLEQQGWELADVLPLIDQ